MTLNVGVPVGAAGRQVGSPQVRDQARQPRQQAQVHRHRRRHRLAGASAAASLGELGYNVLNFCIHDSPRRAHSIAAQGGINAAKNYKNDGDSVYRLFYDTIKGGDYRAREANVYRLAQLSVNIIDQCVAQGVPFAREYGGLLDNRSFGGAQVSRTFYARGQTGQQLLLGAYQALMRQVDAGAVKLFPRREMLDLVVVNGKARGIIVPQSRRPARSSATRPRGRAGDRRLRQGVLPLDQRGELERHGRVARAQARRALRQPVLHADPPDLHPRQRRPPVEAHADERVAPQRRPRLGAEDSRATSGRRREIPEAERDYYLERQYPSFGNLVPRDVASRNAKAVCDEGRGVGETGLSVYLDFADAIERLGDDTIRARYGNLFDMYQRITDEDPYKVPMRIYPAIHYTMGGLWVDYNLMSNVPGLFVLGEANFSDHGANRLGASALMQGLADGYFVIPYTSATTSRARRSSRHDRPRGVRARPQPPSQARIDRCSPSRASESIRTSTARSAASCGTTSAWRGPTRASTRRSRTIRRCATSSGRTSRCRARDNLNQTLDYAGRVADYLEFAELLALDALAPHESCGGHFREESQTPEGEARRDDEDFSYVAAWEFNGVGSRRCCTRSRSSSRERAPEAAELQVMAGSGWDHASGGTLQALDLDPTGSMSRPMSLNLKSGARPGRRARPARGLHGRGRRPTCRSSRCSTC